MDSKELEEAASKRWAKLKKSRDKHFTYSVSSDGYLTVKPKTRKGRVIAYLVYKLGEGVISRQRKNGKTKYVVSISKQVMEFLG